MVSTCYLIPLAQLYNFNSCLHHQVLKIDDWFRLSIYTIYVKKLFQSSFSIWFLSRREKVSQGLSQVCQMSEAPGPLERPPARGPAALPPLLCRVCPPPLPRNVWRHLGHKASKWGARLPQLWRKCLRGGKSDWKGESLSQKVLKNAKMFLS